jgi:hypothetical protein
MHELERRQDFGSPGLAWEVALRLNDRNNGSLFDTQKYRLAARSGMLMADSTTGVWNRSQNLVPMVKEVCRSWDPDYDMFSFSQRLFWIFYRVDRGERLA